MKIISIITNNPIFIEMQYLTLKKFVKEDYQYIIFNDGKSFPDKTNYYNIDRGKNSIFNKCYELNILCINIPNDHHRTKLSASARHVDSLKFIQNYMINNIDEYLLLDGDMFLINNLDLNIYRNYHSAFVLDDRPNYNLKYMWANIFYFNMFKISNFNEISFDFVTGGDSASATSIWLNSYNINLPTRKDIYNPSCNILFKNKYFYYMLLTCRTLEWDELNIPIFLKNTKLLEFIKNDVRNKNSKFFSEVYDNKFFHFRAGSNWMHNLDETHDVYLNKLLYIVKDICK